MSRSVVSACWSGLVRTLDSSAKVDVVGLSLVQGVIQHATINNLAFGRNIEETLRILQALQYVQENPDEVRRNAGPLPAASVLASTDARDR